MLQLRPYQQTAIEKIESEWESGNRRTLAVMATGCHEPLAPILMADGTIKCAQDVEISDKLMGPDGNPRTVLSVHSGTTEMMKVTPVKGSPFIVTHDHVLPFMRTSLSSNPKYEREKGGALVTTTAGDWSYKSKKFKHITKLFRSKAIEHFANNDGSRITIDPYFVGVLLGDGETAYSNTNVTTMDEEIVSVLYEQAEKYNATLRVVQAGKAKTYFFKSGLTGRYAHGGLNDNLKALGLYGKKACNKFVPHYYKTLPINQRLQVIAGLIDTDGCISNTSGCGYDFVSKSRALAEDLAFMCRSVGLAAYVKACRKTAQRGFVGTYWRVSISGECQLIPCRVERRKASSRKQKKSVLRTGIKSIKSVGEGRYNGFTVDGDSLYLMGDFTVTHNCGKTIVMSGLVHRIASHGGRTLILAHRGELLDQAADKIQAMTGLACSREQAEHTSLGEWNSVTVGSVQTLMQEKRLKRFRPDRFSHVFVDEAHHAVSDSYRKVLDYFDHANVLGVTATADRADRRGLSEVFDSLAFEYGMADAIHDGYLCPIEAQMIPLRLDISGVSIQSGDYAVGQLGDALEPYLDSIADEMAERCSNRKTVVFLPLVRTAKHFADMLNARGLSACEVDGQSPDRAEILADFASNKYKVLCNSMLLCLDEQTEILTTRGFVGPNEIREYDLVANWNFDGTVFFEKPHEIVRRPLGLDEHMTSIDSRTINLRVTNTHRMVVSYGANRSKWKKIAADELRNGHLLPTCGVAQPLDVKMPLPPYERLTHKRVESGDLHYTRPADLTLDECRFIGFFLAEGSATHLQSGGTEYKVCQVRDKNPAIVEWFDNIVDSTGFNVVRKESFRQYGQNSKQEVAIKYWSFCRGTGHGSQSRNGLFRIEPYLDHEGTELFWGFNEEQFDALIEGFWYGDGFHGSAESGMPKSIQLRGCYQSLFDLWCAIGSVRGWRCAMYERPQKNPEHNTQYEMRLIKNQPLNISYKTTINQEPYTPEDVWCVRTTSKNIITRRNGRVVVMGNTEGWDCPDVDCIVCLRPTKSRSLYAQICGRGTRLSPETGKEKLLLLDFLWMTGRHDLCRPASLLGANEEVEARISEMVEDAMEDMLGIDLLDAEPQAEQDVQTAREEKLAEELERMRHRKAKLVDPLQYALSICDLDLQNFEPVFAWENQAPTKKQVELLEQRGINPDGMTAGMASKMIDSLKRRQKEGMATPKQVRMLERKGFIHPGTWTFEQASKMMSILANNRWRVPASIDPATYRPE